MTAKDRFTFIENSHLNFLVKGNQKRSIMLIIFECIFSKPRQRSESTKDLSKFISGYYKCIFNIVTYLMEAVSTEIILGSPKGYLKFKASKSWEGQHFS